MRILHSCALLVVLCALLLSGCQAAPAVTPPPPTQAPPPLDLDGVWSGQTDQGQPVNFVLSGRRVAQMQLNYTMENCADHIFKISAAAGAGRWQGHTLILNVPQEVRLSFLSEKSASGAFVFDPSQGLLAASCKPGPATTITFTAQKLER